MNPTDTTSLSVSDAINTVETNSLDGSSMSLTTLFKCEHAEHHAVATSSLAAHAYRGEGNNILVRGEALCNKCQKETAEHWNKLQHIEIMLQRRNTNSGAAFYFAATYRELRDVQMLDSRGLLKADLDRVFGLWFNVVLSTFCADDLSNLYNEMMRLLPEPAVNHAKDLLLWYSQRSSSEVQDSIPVEPRQQLNQGVHYPLSPSSFMQAIGIDPTLNWSAAPPNEQNRGFGICMMGCQTANECFHGNFHRQGGMEQSAEQGYLPTPMMSNVGFPPVPTPHGFASVPAVNPEPFPFSDNDGNVTGYSQSNPEPWHPSPAPTCYGPSSSLEQQPGSDAFFAGPEGSAIGGSASTPWSFYAPTPSAETTIPNYNLYAGAGGQNAYVEGYQNTPVNTVEGGMESIEEHNDDPSDLAMGDGYTTQEEEPEEEEYHTDAIVLAGGEEGEDEDGESSVEDADGESEVDEGTQLPEKEDSVPEDFSDSDTFWDEINSSFDGPGDSCPTPLSDQTRWN